jgi:N-acetylglucosaminyl-diphospho-decaprenol L-rhamnosyltransferase
VSTVAVVVLTHNRAHDLAVTLARMCALAERPRLVVVDNGSHDDTAEMVRTRFPEVDLVRLEHNAGAAGRNAGVARLATTYVAFCDDDSWWAPGSLTHAASILDAHPRLGLVCGRVLVGEEARVDAVSAAMADSPLPPVPELPGRPILGFLCAASMLRREAFVAAGGFQPRFFLGGEEELLAIDLTMLGWALSYLPDVVVHHHPSPRRDAGRRRDLLLRNALWAAWLRRRVPDAVRRSRAVLARTPRRRQRGAALLAALGGLPWVLRERRVVPLYIEEALRRLDGGDYAERRRRRRGVVDSGVASGLASGSSNRLAR